MIKINFLGNSKNTKRAKAPRAASRPSATSAKKVRTSPRKTKSNQRTAAHLILLRVAAIGLTLALAQVLLSTRASFAKPTANKTNGATIRPASGKLLNCSSQSSAPVYLGQSGKWTFNAEVVSEFKLTQVVLKNQKRHDLGSSMEMSIRDQRIASERVFMLKPDIHCNYEVNFPREFSGEKTFQARLVQTCDNMFDGSAELNCNLNQ